MRLAFIAPIFLALLPAPALAEEVAPRPALVEANPVPAREKDERWRTWRSATLVAHGADFLSTEICLRRGTCREAGPLFGSNPTTARLAGIKAATAGLNYLLITKIAETDPKAARIAGMISVGVFGGAALLNLRFALK